MAQTTAEFLAVDEQVPAKVDRDRWGRPKIVPPDGGPAKPYTRASTLGKALDDEAGLTLWKQRMTAVGIAKRRDLILAANAHFDDKSMMSDIVEQAMDAAEAGAAATSGTALHELMDAYDQGREPYMPEEYRADVAAYRKATAGLRYIRSETFVVDDELECAGSYDNLWELRYPAITPDGTELPEGSLHIGDKKTGAEIKFGHCSWAVQLSVYANSLRYDPVTDTRLEPEPINKDWGLIAHVPVMKGTAQLYWIDLKVGRELAKLAYTVRQARRTKTMRPAEVAPTWQWRIGKASTVQELYATYQAAFDASEWTDELTALAAAKKKELAA